MTIFILLVGGLGWAIFSAMASAPRYTGSSSVNQYGPQLFMWLIIFEVVLLAFITPALTAGAISGERERQTIDLLFVTPLRPFAIIWGKLLASMSFVLLLLMLSVPIFSLVFLFGGIELDQMIYAFIVVGVSALTFGLVGIAFSSLFRRTLAATVAAYGAAFVLMVGTLVYGLLFPIEIDASAGSVPAPPAVTMLSPILPLVTIANNAPIPCYGSRYSNSARDALLRSGGGGGYIGPQGASSTVLCVVSGGGYQTAMAMSPKGSYGGPSQTSATAGTKITSGLFQNWQYWQANVVMQLVICFLALALSAYILPPIRRFRLRRTPATAPAAG
jgi:ABC-type transport system involved in multi-copper enzyme maturation permease subunit